MSVQAIPFDPVPGARRRIYEARDHMRRLNNKYSLMYGVVPLAVPLGDGPAGSDIGGSGWQTASQLTLVGGLLAGTVPSGVGQVVGAVSIGVAAVLDLIGDWQNNRECNNRREAAHGSMLSDLNDITELCGISLDDERGKRLRFRIYELLPVMSGAFDWFDGSSPGRPDKWVHEAPWGAMSTSSARYLSGFAFTSGRTAAVTPVVERFDGVCNRAQIILAEADRVRILRNALEQLPDVPTRLRFLIGQFGVYLGPWGDPTAGLEDIFAPAEMPLFRMNVPTARTATLVMPQEQGGGGFGLMAALAAGAYLLLRR